MRAAVPCTRPIYRRNISAVARTNAKEVESAEGKKKNRKQEWTRSFYFYPAIGIVIAFSAQRAQEEGSRRLNIGRHC